MAKGKQNIQSESIEKKYTLFTSLGEGGNAEVLRAKEIDSGVEVALKKLINRTIEKEQRFSDEIRIMHQNSDIPGIMPIHDMDMDNSWYTMPIAVPIMKWSNELFEASPNIPFYINRIDRSGWINALGHEIINLTNTLIQLSGRNIHHRDIKPDNIYWHDGRACLGDFGLVEFPDKNNNLTREDKGLGAIFTIAPEMKRNPKGADGEKADVYSLAKTFWMLLTSDDKGFDGQYTSTDETHGLRFFGHIKKEYLADIEELLTKSTSNKPEARPSLIEFKSSLENWLATYNNNIQKERKDWGFITNRIFGNNIPERTKFTNRDVIVNVLNVLGQSTSLNHMFFPNGGGLDFSYAEIAPEDGFIYIATKGFLHLIKPKALYFESFYDPHWNYFLIECEEVDPIPGICVCRHGDQELVEDTPGHYVCSIDAVYGVYDYDSGEPLPKDAKVVYRFTKGKFLIVMKTCGYNHIQAAYDGRHNVMSNDELRKYISNILQLIKDGESEGYTEDEILSIPQVAAHPYPERTTLFNIPREEKSEKLPSPDDYIKKNYTIWNFKDILPAVTKSGNLSYRFIFKLDQFVSIFDKSPIYYLGADGYIKTDDNKNNEYYEVYDRETAVALLESLNRNIVELCAGYDISFENLGYCFVIELKRIGNPSHLFTKEEIKKAMRNADDRLNNQLVIDENGYIHIVDRQMSDFYPVSHETWCSRNNYVGKYSSLSTLDDVYIDSLSAWLEYLQDGIHVFCHECFYDETPENLINQIEKYYNM